MGGGELLPYLTLRRCWKQRLEEKGRHKGDEERSYHGESDFSWERPVRQQSAVNTNTKKIHTHKKKRFKKLCLRLIFFFEHSWRRPFGCWDRKRERESDCDVVVTLWSHNSHKNGRKKKRCIILQYLQINIATHGVCITSANSVTFSELMQRGVVLAEPQ